jgi:hypothetical protein
METFLIRVWLPADAKDGSQTGALHGLAEHVRSGLATAFTDGEQLCAWLEATASEQGGASVGGARMVEGGQ